MTVKKKQLCFEDEKHSKASSMMIKEGKQDDHEDESSDSEEELYNLMRGHTSLMITEELDSESDNEADEGEDESKNEEQEAEPTEKQQSSSSTNYDWGAPLTEATTPSWGNNENWKIQR